MPRKRPPKTNRRAKGTGSIFFDRRRGVWVNRVPVGRTSDRKLSYTEFRAPTQESAIALGKAAAPPAPGITLAEWSRRWLASLDVREQSRETYDVNLRTRILPALGTLAVSRLTAFHVEEAARQWGLSVGVTTVRQTLATLSACLQGAVRAEILTRNPARLARKPRPQPYAHDPFTEDELRRILVASLGDRRLYPFALCAALGCRIGEAIAIRPATDYNSATGELSITRTLVRHKTGHARRFGPPKSRHSLRTITVPAIARTALSQPPDTTSYSTYHRRWRSLLKRLSIRVREAHQLRHSVISLAIAAGAPVANVARDAGDSVQTIVATYLHPVPGLGICEAMESLFTGGTQSGAEVARKGKKQRKGTVEREK